MIEKLWKNRVRLTIWALHFLCCALLILVVFILYRYAGQESFRDAVRNVPYKDSRSLADQMAKDILNVVSLANLSEKFETDGTVDLDKVVCHSSDSEGKSQSYTLQNVLDYGRSIGIVLDASHRVVVQPAGTENEAGEQPAEDRERTPASSVSSFQNGDFSLTLSSDIDNYSGKMDEKTVLLSTLYQLEEYYALREYLHRSGEMASFHYRFVLADSRSLVTSVNDSRLTMESLTSYDRYFALDNKKDLVVSNLPPRFQARIREALSGYERLEDGIYEILAAVERPARYSFQRSRERYLFETSAPCEGTLAYQCDELHAYIFKAVAL